MELASQECCLHRILFTCRYVTFVLVIITFVFTLYSVVVLEKNRTRTTIFKGECSVFLKKKLLWMKTMHYPNTIRSHLVTIVPMARFSILWRLKFCVRLF